MTLRRRLALAGLRRHGRAAAGTRARLRRHAADPDQADLRAFDRSRIGAEALRRHVTTLAGWRRSVEDPEGYARAAGYIEAAWTGLGLEVHRDALPGDGDAHAPAAPNVRVRLGPPSPRRRDGLLVVGAHYDACALPGGAYPGADDNASGVALLLELARVWRDLEVARPVELVAYANEEPPHFGTDAMGSVAHAAARAAGDERVHAMVALECVGYYSEREGSQHVPDGLRGSAPERGDFVAVASDLRARRLVRDLAALVEHHGFPAAPVAAPAYVAGVGLSDHASFLAHGIPACMVTDTAMHRNPHYHQPTDTPDTLDYRRMARLGEALALAIPEL